MRFSHALGTHTSIEPPIIIFLISELGSESSPAGVVGLEWPADDGAGFAPVAPFAFLGLPSVKPRTKQDSIPKLSTISIQNHTKLKKNKFLKY